MRLDVVLVYLIKRMTWRGRSFLGDSLRAGIVWVVLGTALEALWPQYRIGALHIIFISGFSFIVLTVAIRVIFGHSGNAQLFRRRLPFFIIVAVLIFLAMLSRYVADSCAESAHRPSRRAGASSLRRLRAVCQLAPADGAN